MECCFINKEYLDKCRRSVSKNSFFCSEHKRKLFKINEFTLTHGGNRVKILEDMEIKTAKSLGIRGIGGARNKKEAFDKVFFQLFFPGHTIQNSNLYISGSITTGRKKGEAGTIQVDIKILEKLSKMGKKIHFANTMPFGMCHPEYCVEWDIDYSSRENLNRIYHFILLNNYDNEIRYWKNKKDKKLSFEELREKVLDMDNDSYDNEIVISGNVPLIIRKKNYVLDDNVEEN